MSFKSLETFTVICNGCGKDINADNCEYSGTTIAGCEADIENADWTTDRAPNGEKSGDHYCPDCADAEKRA